MQINHPHNYMAALWLCAVLFLSACSGGSSTRIPLDKIKADLADEPTYSVVLEDMREEGTFFKTYFHKYLVVKPDGSNKTDWLEVPETFYNQNLEFLGMALVSKKDGTLDNQVAPPGYSYVGDPKYGSWRQDSQGGSFWEFYGKYALLSSLFGGWNRPIYRNDYAMYNQSRSMNRPFFGRNKEFGSSGSVVKTKNPGFYSRRMEANRAAKSSFKQKAAKRVGRTKTGFRSRSGGIGK